MHIYPFRLPVFALICLLCYNSISSAVAISFTSHRTKNIPYLAATTPGFDPVRHLLDVYSPNHQKGTAKPVVVFIHGGNWNSGNKNIYWFIGRRLAKQGVVAVIINYRLAPNVQVPAMSHDCARAVQWVSQHIADYGGDPNKIYVMGHSAGGGLAALLATDDALFSAIGMPKNPVKGAILDDPAGIDMYDFLKETKNPADKQYLVSFGTNPEGWRAVSPLFKVRAGLPPMLLFVGEKTYPSIIQGSNAFQEKLLAAGNKSQLTVIPGKEHVPMVKQLFWKRNIIYRELLALVKG
ncbi:alpha/beta hydrolase [Fibrella aquatilis]|uniref:Alpha/beta hydrolase n=1 Tax=Fibrella aquatilis TaxID=2817059 RepID=A0A939G8H8_9BACT|nr:alpha/beta hydrolase [Fibrella aquatilis]MBO0932579.1 alpha/beta hydrolase [Fibrella aquatilis]